MNVYAHRGYSGKFPENTMLAFREAEKTGCYGIELDVQTTKDGVVVIIHDETLDRVSDRTGYVRDYTYEELKQIDVTKNWDGKFGFQGIPTFDEYCAWVRDTRLVTNVEIKSGVFYYEDLEKKTVELVRKHGLESRIIFSSFNHSSIVKTKELAPEIPVGALLDHQGIGNAGYYCHEYGFQYYHPGVKGLNRETVENCRKYGIAINVWTVNDLGDLERICEWGCQGIITNYPGVIMGAPAWR